MSNKEEQQKLFNDFTQAVISSGEFFTDVAGPFRDKIKEALTHIEESIKKIPENEDASLDESRLQLQEMQMLLEEMLNNMQCGLEDSKRIVKGCLEISKKINPDLLEDEEE